MSIRIGVASMIALAVCVGCQWQKQEPKTSAIQHYVRGQILAEKGDDDAALTELARAIRVDPKLSVAHAAAGDIYRRRGDFQLAERCYLIACDANPYAFRPHYNLGVVYQALADEAKTPQDADKYLHSAVDVYLRAITIDPADSEANLNLSSCYFQLGKPNLAEQYCQAAVKAKPNNTQALSNLGIIYDSTDRLYDAIRAYKASLELDPHQPKLLMNLANTYMRQGRPKSALYVLDLALKETPDDPAVFEQMGACQLSLKDYTKAQECYEKAIDKDPNDPIAYRGLGVVFMSQFIVNPAKTDFRDKGLEAWNRSLELDSNQPDLSKLVEKYSPKFSAPSL